MPTQPEDYTVGWISAIETEFVVACELLDEEYSRRDAPRLLSDQNAYHFGRIHEHNVVIACLPKGRYGTNSAALLASQMLQSFPSIRIGLMVGIGGAAPSLRHDIRLGDVVVSSPTPSHGGVVQYDFGKAVQHQEFSVTGHLSAPPRVLLNALTAIHAKHERKGHKIMTIIETMIANNRRLGKKFSRPAADFDRLYTVLYDHHAQENCDCVQDERSPDLPPEFVVSRPVRQPDEDDPAIHYGLVASANTLVKDGILRDRLTKHHDILCFEMEAAGVMNDFPCVVIRGISDYSDSHKSDLWQGFAAATAAAYAKELLEIIPGTEIQDAPLPETGDSIEQAKAQVDAGGEDSAVQKILKDADGELNLYETLGVSKDASVAHIKTAYRKLVLKNHPDKFSNEAQKNKQSEIFNSLLQAYDTLGDEESRRRYDDRVRRAELLAEIGASPPSRPSAKFRSSNNLEPTYGEKLSTWYYEDGTRKPIYEKRGPRMRYYAESSRTSQEHEADRPRVRRSDASGTAWKTTRATAADTSQERDEKGVKIENGVRKARASPRESPRSSPQGSHEDLGRRHRQSANPRRSSQTSQDETLRVPSSRRTRSWDREQYEPVQYRRRSGTGSSDLEPAYYVSRSRPSSNERQDRKNASVVTSTVSSPAKVGTVFSKEKKVSQKSPSREMGEPGVRRPFPIAAPDRTLRRTNSQSSLAGGFDATTKESYSKSWKKR